MKEYWINVYPHGLGAQWFDTKRSAEIWSQGYAIYRLHVRFK